jgi:23S rRNA-/tRNA-specific pseudouridylate synthase
METENTLAEPEIVPGSLFTLVVKKIPVGQLRADKYLSILLGKLQRKNKLKLIDKPLSRSATQKLFKDGRVVINGKAVKPNFGLSIGDKIEILVPEEEELKKLFSTPTNAEDLDVVFETEQYLIVNKPAGLLVHGAHNGN